VQDQAIMNNRRDTAAHRILDTIHMNETLAREHEDGDARACVRRGGSNGELAMAGGARTASARYDIYAAGRRSYCATAEEQLGRRRRRFPWI
jgi:hypothetical protein